MIETLATWSALFIVGLIVYSAGYAKGVKDTERRWSEAVERKHAHDEADRQNKELAL